MLVIKVSVNLGNSEVVTPFNLVTIEKCVCATYDMPKLNQVNAVIFQLKYNVFPTKSEEPLEMI